MEKLIITFVTGGIVLNLIYIVAILNNSLISRNPWYLFLAGILMIVAAVIIRNRKN